MKSNLPVTESGTPHVYHLRVYYEDTDAGGIVYHANYLRFAERARTEALRELGLPHAAMVEQFALMFVVRRVEIDYLRPARLDDLLSVVTAAVAVGGASARLRQAITAEDGTELAVAHVDLACMGASMGVGETRPRRIPLQWRAALASLLASDTDKVATI